MEGRGDRNTERKKKRKKKGRDLVVEVELLNNLLDEQVLHKHKSRMSIHTKKQTNTPTHTTNLARPRGTTQQNVVWWLDADGAKDGGVSQGQHNQLVQLTHDLVAVAIQATQAEELLLLPACDEGCCGRLLTLLLCLLRGSKGRGGGRRDGSCDSISRR